MARKRFIVSGTPRLAKQNYNFYPVLKPKAVVNPNQNLVGKSTNKTANTNDPN